MDNKSIVTWGFVGFGVFLIVLGVLGIRDPQLFNPRQRRRYVRLNAAGILAYLIEVVIDCFPPEWHQGFAWIVGSFCILGGLASCGVGIVGFEKVLAKVTPNAAAIVAAASEGQGGGKSRDDDGFGGEVSAAVAIAPPQSSPSVTPTPDNSTPTPTPLPTVDPKISEIDRLMLKAGQQWEAGKKDVSLMLAEEALKDAEANLPAGHPKIDEVRKKVEGARGAVKGK